VPDVSASLRDAVPRPFWLDRPDAPEPAPPLSGDTRAELVVVGAGFNGLWTALLAKERDPDRDVVLLEAGTVAWAASGRNGGMVSSSLTHGLAHGAEKLPGELRRLEELGLQNLDEIEATIAREGIDCAFERNGKLAVATRPHEVDNLRHVERLAQQYGRAIRFLDREEIQAQIHSPTFLAGTEDTEGYAIVDPARLAWGLREAVLRRGVRLHERTRATAVTRTGATVSVRTTHGSVKTDQVVLATNAFPSLLRRLRLYTVPVYDYALMTEPLTPEQRASIGWRGRHGLSDSGNRFHYSRLTVDDRILWGGFDAVYHFGSRMGAKYDQRPETFRTLAEHFFETFPQLEGVRFTHRWGGAIDTCTRFIAFHGTAMGGRVAYSLGFTGLGVAATRFAANVMLDLLSGERTERTELELVRTRPLPFPPEPARSIGIGLMVRSLARADETGRRNLFLRLMDRIGFGFDS